MAYITRSIDIGADRQSVWMVIGALGDVASWNPNISGIDFDSDSRIGVGTARTCYLAQGGHIDEVVAEWEPGCRVQFAIGNHGGIRSADMAMELKDTERGTTVTAVADYHVAFGPLGPVIDRIAVKRQMAQMLDASLHGLKDHIEATNLTNERDCHE